MWSYRPKYRLYCPYRRRTRAQPPHPSCRPPPPRAACCARLARGLARKSLLLPLSLGAAGLLAGVPEARAGQSVSVQVQAMPEAEPGSLSQDTYAVPGLRNRIHFVLTCTTYPPGGWCDGGYLVANFNGTDPGQKVVSGWTSSGRDCVVNDYYLACPMEPVYDREQQRAFFELDVKPWSYTDNHGVVQGTDGFGLAPSPFTIEMRGQGAFRIGKPEDIVIPETSALATTHFVNDGPSTNRRLTLRFGPFPQHLAPILFSPDMPCALTPDRVLQCGPVDQPPDSRDIVMLGVKAVPPLPHVPDIELISVTATSDLTPYVRTDFLVHIVERPHAP